MDVKPIRSEADYQQALKRIEAIFEAQAGTPEGDLLAVLSVLVENYEDEHFPIAAPDPVEAIEFHMQRLGMTRRELEVFISSRARVSEILNRRRRLTLGMIRKVSLGLGIPAEILLQSYALADEKDRLELSVSV